MQRGRGGRDDIFGFGDPFSAFGGFGRPGSLISNFFGWRDPFDDPFFTQPFGGMVVPGMPRPGGLMPPSMFGPSLLANHGSLYGETSNAGFLEQAPIANKSKGPIIEELPDDEEGEEANFEKKVNPRKHSRSSKEPIVPGMPRPGGLMPPSMFGPSLLANHGSLYGETSNAGFLEQAPIANKSKGPIIEELPDDEEGEEANFEKKVNPRKHSRSSKEPIVQDPDGVVEEKKMRGSGYRNHINQFKMMQPQSHSFTFQSSTVSSYGGSNRAYYTSSTTRRMGGDGVFVEESKEADTTTGRATHRVSRGIQEKGHSVTRKLNSDGMVDTTQVLHNLNEDELLAFEQSWKGNNAERHLPGWNPEINLLDGGNFRSGSSSRQGGRTRGWALPSTERPHDSGRMRPQSQTKPFKPRGSMK